MQQMLAMMARQQKILQQMHTQRVAVELKADSVRLLTSSGRVKESAQLYFEQVDQCFCAKRLA